MMTAKQKLDFVHKQTKIALEHVQHFDSGGTALSGPSTVGTENAANPNNGIAGAIGSVLGTNNNFQATGAKIQQGTNANQLNQAYNGAQGALGAANNLNASLTPGVNQGANTQNTLTQQLQAEALGQGPNPAQTALNQNTGQNIAQAAALAASTRGAGTNAGLIAQNAANTGAQTQQTSIGQEATQEAQQQLNAQNALQNLAATQVGQGTTATQLQNQTQQNEQNILQGANTAANNAAVSSQNNINATNAAVAAGNQQANQNILSGIGQGINSLGGAIGLFAEGGEVPEHIQQMAEIYHPQALSWQNSSINPGQIQETAPLQIPQIQAKPTTFIPSLAKKKNPDEGEPPAPDLSADNSIPPPPDLTSVAPAVPPTALHSGGAVEREKKYVKGGKLPGKPKINHDAYSNDTVKAKLTPGEGVIDIDTMKDPGKLGQMARFVIANIERKKMGRKL